MIILKSFLYHYSTERSKGKPATTLPLLPPAKRFVLHLQAGVSKVMAKKAGVRGEAL
jgi:hypothetical protein